MTRNVKSKNYIIYSQKMAKQLINRGFKLIKIARNKVYPKYNVFLFEDTEQLREALGVVQIALLSDCDCGLISED